MSVQKVPEDDFDIAARVRSSADAFNEACRDAVEAGLKVDASLLPLQTLAADSSYLAASVWREVAKVRRWDESAGSATA